VRRIEHRLCGGHGEVQKEMLVAGAPMPRANWVTAPLPKRRGSVPSRWPPRRAIVKFVGGSSADAVANTLAMRHITLGANSAFTLAALDICGTPAGIDIAKVVDTRILPVINTGIAHREPGIGQIGAGITRAPMACCSAAVLAPAELLPPAA
jgi:hypothetical protein